MKFHAAIVTRDNTPTSVRAANVSQQRHPSDDFERRFSQTRSGRGVDISR